MQYLSVKEVSSKWKISERMVRNYCQEGRIEGAFLTGKTWNVPQNAIKPARKSESMPKTDNELLNVLREQKMLKIKDGIYHDLQIEFTYNSNNVKGNELTQDQIRSIFENNTIMAMGTVLNVDDIIEAVNHFKCVDYVIDKANKPLTEEFIKCLYAILISGTIDYRKEANIGADCKKVNEKASGEYKREYVKDEITALLATYNAIENKSLKNIIQLYYYFEKIHPFQDVNGMVGRLIMLKECLNCNIVPFIVDEEHNVYYYQGMKEWQKNKSILINTILSCQDRFKAKLDYFRISY